MGQKRTQSWANIYQEKLNPAAKPAETTEQILPSLPPVAPAVPTYQKVFQEYIKSRHRWHDKLQEQSTGDDRAFFEASFVPLFKADSPLSDRVIGLPLSVHSWMNTIKAEMESPAGFSGLCPDELNHRLLLGGDPGTGKSYFAKQCGAALDLPFFHLNAGNFSSQWMGQSEKMVSVFFDELKIFSQRVNKRCILFVDEADGIFGARNQDGNSYSRQMDGIQNIFLQNFDAGGRPGPLDPIVIAATNAVHCFDPAARGRFGTSVSLDSPTAATLSKIIEVKLENKRHNLSPDELLSLGNIAHDRGLNGRHIRDVINRSFTSLVSTVRRENLATAHYSFTILQRSIEELGQEYQPN